MSLPTFVQTLRALIPLFVADEVMDENADAKKVPEDEYWRYWG